jgi:L-seryl-tRNA(Ser) seleniumtransferase
VIGGGAAPEAQLPGALVALRSDRLSASALAERLRRHTPPIIVRAERNRVLIDLRTVAFEEETLLLEALLRLAQPAQPGAASVKM